MQVILYTSKHEKRAILYSPLGPNVDYTYVFNIKIAQNHLLGMQTSPLTQNTVITSSQF
jgi:hypothetical protein